VVIDQGAAVGLEATEIEGLDLAIEAPVTQVALGQHREAVSRLHHHHLCTSR